MAHRLTLMMLAALPSAAFGQEVPDLTGTWEYTVEGLPVHEQCGQEYQTGELIIERKITARAYRGKARAVRSLEKCPATETLESTATIRVKDGNLVTIEYDEKNWMLVRVRYVDGIMSGDVGNGISTTIRRSEEPADEVGLTDEQLAELDEFFGTIEPELNEAFKEEFYDKYRKYLYKSGLSRSDARQVADLTIERMTSCVISSMHESVVLQEIPVERILTQRGVAVLFNPKNVDGPTKECIKDAERNAGIRIY